MRTSLSRGLVIACAVGAAGLSACGGADDGSRTGSDDADDQQVSQSSAQQGKDGASESPGPPEQTPQVAPADLANFDCARQQDGRWKATGDIVNPTKQPMVYTVTVVTVDGEDEVLGERAESFQLGPEDRTSFTWPKFFRGSADTCMPHVEREPA